jgi:hypothetical protein
MGTHLLIAMMREGQACETECPSSGAPVCSGHALLMEIEGDMHDHALTRTGRCGNFFKILPGSAPKRIS